MGRFVSAEGSTALDRWPLIGRSDELAFARDRITAGGSVVIAGDAGVGKTRLARELIESAEAEGRGADWAVATYAARPIPFGALTHLVSPGAVLAGREAALQAASDSFSRRGDGPVVIGIDDAHLLDGVSAVLVHQLVSRHLASAVLTVRSGEPVPDPILGLWKDELAVRVELQPLARAEVAEVLTTVLDGPVDGASLHLLWQLSTGNALFLRELVLQGIETGSLRADDDLWHWDGSVKPGQRLRDVVVARLGTLDDVERDALEVLAVGEPVPVDCLPELFPLSVVARLERRGLVRAGNEAGGVLVRLAHPLFGEVVRADAPTLRSNEIRRRLADGFHAHPELGPENTLRVATWRTEIGDGSDPQVLVEGARRAWAVGEVGLAERLARLALDAHPDFEASYLLGKALVGEGRLEEAVQTWQSAEDLSVSDAQRATLAAGIAYLLMGGLGRPGDAEDAVRRAAGRMQDPTARRDLDTVRALMRAISAGTTGQRIENATAVLRDPRLSKGFHATGTLAAVTASIEAGHFDLAIQAASDAIASVDAQRGGAPATMLRTCLADALWPAGHLDEAESVASTGYARALEHADHRRGLWCRLLGSIALFRGDARRAVAWLKEGELVLREQDDSSLRGVLVRLTMAAALLGDLDLAGRAVQRTENSEALFARGWDLELARARAWLCVARGERSTAVRHLENGARAAACRESWTVEAFAVHDLARFGEPVHAAVRLGELAEIVDGPLVRTMAAQAHGLACGDGVVLDAAAVAFAELGCCLYAAEAAAAAAAAHRAAGRRSSAAVSTNRAHAWMGRCEDVRTPALVLADHDDDLTAREREVATLAARGLSDRRIADGLFVSVRTVHAHLRSAYTKLGVSGRKDLASVLGAEPLAGG
jgi:DNA-binding CsgD family transcriptional regulator/tetratricopeptide (TPR) repeat protein